MAPQHQKKILAISSSGGHWVQLLRLREAFAGHKVVFATSQDENAPLLPNETLIAIPEANRSNIFCLLYLMLKVLIIIIRERPDVIISTGAACGCFALLFGKVFGARTIWLESVANSEELSLSTKLVRPLADLFLTQWPHMARANGPTYRGSIL